MVVTFSLGLSGLFSRFNILESEFKKQAFALAEGCADIAISKLAADSNYTGNESIVVDDSPCSILPIEVSGGQRVIKTWASVKDARTNLRLVVDVTGGGGNDYAIWAGGAGCGDSLDWSGGNVTISGNIHSNKIKISGSSNVVSGNVEYVVSYSDSGGNGFSPVQVSAVPIPVQFFLADYAPGGAKALAAGAQYHYFAGNLDVGVMTSQGWYNPITGEVESGLYYATGEIDLGDSGMHGIVTLVTPDTIKLSGSNQNFTPFSDSLLLFSGYTGCGSFAISVSGSTNLWGGIMYAPGGKIEMGGSGNSTVNGCAFSNTILLNGSDLLFTYNPLFCGVGGGPGGPGSVDVRSWDEVPNLP